MPVSRSFTYQVKASRKLTDQSICGVLIFIINYKALKLAISHTASWIIGSVAASGFVVSSLFVHSLSDGAPPSPYKRVATYSVVPDLWICRKNTNVRGHEYTYSVNLRNGSTGPSRLACEGVKPINVSPMEPRSRMGPNGIRPPMMRVDPDAK